MKLITIGRDNSCDIVVNDSRVSRVHANIFQNGDGYTFRDTSTNGTQINGVTIHHSEMYIRFGDSVLFAGSVPLPWNKLQNLFPKESKQADAGNNKIVKEEKAGLGWLIPGYLFAFLGGYFGMIIGISLLVSKIKLADGTKMKRYNQESRTHGTIILILAFFAFIVWNIIAFAIS
ncbi:MAG: FHA domain-containing protein [Prolixibacteraceae bacterium]|jgi:pSer/pThr/pTyr-binding forkhead associated (FHA) protein